MKDKSLNGFSIDFAVHFGDEKAPQVEDLTFLRFRIPACNHELDSSLTHNMLFVHVLLTLWG